ncbi:unnamed protein product [Adineta ricciae]|uniref:G-protein coupled receptors family 1 profile domain-containing protein n=1 Tax=Adineta ricciae TaxID=249248 RepID=A0A813RTR6_ADIRI|nr:unnamed protein product [Adineta ricciae]
MSNETGSSSAILAFVHRVETIALPVLIIFGSICNIITFIVMRRRRMRVSSTCFYMATLAVTDTVVLWTGCLNQWFYMIQLQTLVVKSNLSCKLLPFLFVFFADASVWIIVCMSFERYFAVSRPLKASQMCTTRRAKWVLLTIFGVFVLIDGHYLITLELQLLNDEYPVCHPKIWARLFVEKIFVYIDALKYSAIPFCILVVLSILIIQRVFHAEGISAQLQNLNYLRNYRRYTLTTSPTLFSRSPSTLGINSAIQTNSSSNTRVGRRVTLMLLSVSIAFCIFSAPMSLMQIIQSVTKPGHYEIPLAIGKAVAELCQYINHSCSFFLYALTGRVFRREFIRLFFPTRFNSKNLHAPGGAVRMCPTGRGSLIPHQLHQSSRQGSLYSIDTHRHGSCRKPRRLTTFYLKQYNMNRNPSPSYTVKSPLLSETNGSSSLNRYHYKKQRETFPEPIIENDGNNTSLYNLWNMIGRKKERRETDDGPLLVVKILKPSTTKPSSV